MKAELNLKIVPVKSEEQAVIAQFFHSHFYPGEPLNASLGRLPAADNIPFVSLVNEGLSFKAINLLETSEDNIAGVVINTEASLGKKKKSIPGDKEAIKIHKLLKELDEKSKIWEVVNSPCVYLCPHPPHKAHKDAESRARVPMVRLPDGNTPDGNCYYREHLRDKKKMLSFQNENHFNVVAVAVDKKYYGHKIGQKLVEESLKLAKSLNYKHASIECSSYYSAKFAVEMGFELLLEIPYDQYLDENNEQIFKVSKPHAAIKKFVKRL